MISVSALIGPDQLQCGHSDQSQLGMICRRCDSLHDRDQQHCSACMAMALRVSARSPAQAPRPSMSCADKLGLRTWLCWRASTHPERHSHEGRAVARSSRAIDLAGQSPRSLPNILLSAPQTQDTALQSGSNMQQVHSTQAAPCLKLMHSIHLCACRFSVLGRSQRTESTATRGSMHGHGSTRCSRARAARWRRSSTWTRSHMRCGLAMPATSHEEMLR